FLFSGTIKENLLFGDQDADSVKIQDVLEMAQLTETIALFPKGIETIIGEKGVMLSGGQKQRIALARAFLKSSPILILDDPVSQVDMETASKIVKVIESFVGNKTIVIVSHRFSIFRNADHIIVLDKGDIIEQGTHLELIEKKGYYTRAWQMQESEDNFTQNDLSINLSDDNMSAYDNVSADNSGILEAQRTRAITKKDMEEGKI
ncbi:MAG: ABC transporter ATP-binding protein, partial [Desulfamplus sp.]|nr:ABC transporter ATP-binding protein [Desulfamplus sp.]